MRSLPVREIIDALGLTIVGGAGVELTAYCPLHPNTNTPSFSINGETGNWICFSGSCGKSGGLRSLWEQLRPSEPYPVSEHMRRQVEVEHKQGTDFSEEIETFLSPGKGEKDEDWTEVLDRLSLTEEAAAYMESRGFRRGTLETFEITFSPLKKRIVIPVRDENYKLRGLIGRSITDDDHPKYKYSKEFPKRGILFNLQNAKSYKRVILVEGSLDCMRVVQAGYPNTCAVLGSNLSDGQTKLIEKYFLDVIIFSDNDKAGYGLAKNIAYKCSSRNVSFVNWDLAESYKDPGAMTDDLIHEVIDKRVSDIEVLLAQLP